MASTDCIEHINSLPSYVLWEVFSYLPLADRKTAALVCDLWGQEAFSFRLMDNVRLRISCHMMENWAFTRSLLRNSSRKYRKVAFGSNCDSVEYACIQELLGEFSLIEEISFKYGCSLAQLKEFAHRMPRLKSLTTLVMDPEELAVEPLEFPVLDQLSEMDLEINKDDILNRDRFDVLRMAPNVQRLRISLSGCDQHVRALEVLKAYAPQLRTFDLTVSYDWPHIGELRLEELKVLKLRGLVRKPEERRLRQLFRGLSMLKSAHLDFSITKSTLEVISSSCPKLHTLDIRADDLDVGTMKCLDDMPSLRIFMVNHLHVEFLERSAPVIGVRELHLLVGNANLGYPAYVDKLIKVFPNVSKIRISDEGLRRRSPRFATPYEFIKPSSSNLSTIEI